MSVYETRVQGYNRKGRRRKSWQVEVRQAIEKKELTVRRLTIKRKTGKTEKDGVNSTQRPHTCEGRKRPNKTIKLLVLSYKEGRSWINSILVRTHGIRVVRVFGTATVETLPLLHVSCLSHKRNMPLMPYRKIII